MSSNHITPANACGALTNTNAEGLARAMIASKAKAFLNGHSLTGMTFAGRWQHRRYVWSPAPPNEVAVFDTPVPYAIRDHVNDTITLPIVHSPEFYVNELRGFGMAAASKARAATKGIFDLVDDADGNIHRVPKYHHVAACGYRGPWPDTVLDADAFKVSCTGCVAASKPKKPVPKPKTTRGQI